MTSRVLAGRSRAAIWAALGLVTLIAGYLDLSRGGTELAPVLLIIGYCVCVPLMIWLWPAAPNAKPRPARADAERRPSYRTAAIAALAVFVLYLVTLAPTTAMWDTSEYIAAVKVLGLPHPPGNPFFMLIGHVFGMLPLPVSYAERVNILAALSSALSAGLWFLITERVLATWLPQRWQRLVGGAVAVLVGATSFTVWNQSVVNEKVYTVSLLGIAVISWLMVQWCTDPERPKSDRMLVIAAYLTGLGYTNHPAGFLAIPAIGVAILVRRPHVLLRWRLVLAGAVALVFGLTPFLYEPIRAAYFPMIDEGEPTACTTHFAWSCTFDQLTFQRLEANIGREQYGKPPVLDRQAPFSAQVAMWWLYFKWQWLRDAYNHHPFAQDVLAALFFVLGLAGAYEHWRRDRSSFWYFGTLVFTLTLALIFYLNFKYAWSQSPELGNSVPREPRDRDYFYLWSFSAWSVWVALGLAFVWETLASLIGSERAKRGAEYVALPNKRSWLLASPVLALALIPLITNAGQAPRSGQRATRSWAVDILNSVEPYSILITNGDNDTFPLWYAQAVEGIRPDVIVAVQTYLGIDWFARQLIRRPVRAYDPAQGPAIYRNRVWPKPSGPPLDMTFQEADAIPPIVALREPQLFRKGKLVAMIPAGYLTRDQIIVLRFIKDSFPQRPIYFTNGGYAESLGLTPYLLTQGLVEKLEPDSVKTSRDTIPMPGGHFDLPGTLARWTMYEGPQELIKENGWIDRASLVVPFDYAFVGELLGQALTETGQTAQVKDIADTVERIARAAKLPRAGGTAGE